MSIPEEELHSVQPPPRVSLTLSRDQPRRLWPNAWLRGVRVSGLWLSNKQAGTPLAAARAALTVKAEQIEAENAEATELTNQLAAELEARQAGIEAAQGAEAKARSDAAGLRTELGAARQRAATAEARATELEKRTDDLNAELTRVNGQNANLVRALTAGTGKPGRPNQGKQRR